MPERGKGGGQKPPTHAIGRAGLVEAIRDWQQQTIR